MHKLYTLILVLLFPCYISAQTQAYITINTVKENDNKLIINYDIKNYKNQEIFFVSMSVKNKNGERINFNNVKGAIGSDIAGGTNKKIIWDLKKDSIYLDEKVEIKLFADVNINISYLSYNRLAFKTLLFPGSGLTELSSSKNYSANGYLCYGLLLTSYFTHRSANKKYDLYLSETNADKRSDLYAKTLSRKKFARVLTLSTFTIWTINYAKFHFRYRKMQNKYIMGENLNFNIGYNIYSDSPTFGLSYRF